MLVEHLLNICDFGMCKGKNFWLTVHSRYLQERCLKHQYNPLINTFQAIKRKITGNIYLCFVSTYFTTRTDSTLQVFLNISFSYLIHQFLLLT